MIKDHTRVQVYLRNHLKSQFDALCAWKGVGKSNMLNVIVSEYCQREFERMEKAKTFEKLLRKAMLDARVQNLKPPKIENIHSRKKEKLEEEPRDVLPNPLPDWRDDWEF
jgi:hypothetical protein